MFPWGNRTPTAAEARFGAESPVAVCTKKKNYFGLCDMIGNVWEWCADPFRVRSLSAAAKSRNRAAAAGKERVMKGGSFLCHRSYCYRYRIAARTGA